MATLVLPDSNIYINAIRAGVDPFEDFATHLEDWEFSTCGTVVMEVCRGLREPAVRERFQDRFKVMIFLPTTNAVWQRATQLAWTLDRKGAVLPVPDLVIAACALQAGAIVFTGDAHFQQIPGLRVLERLG